MWSNGPLRSLNKKPFYKKHDINIFTEQPFVPGILICMHFTENSHESK